MQGLVWDCHVACFQGYVYMVMGSAESEFLGTFKFQVRFRVEGHRCGYCHLFQIRGGGRRGLRKRFVADTKIF